MDTVIHKHIRDNESLAVRIKKWQSRVTNLQKLLNASNDGISGLSGGPPAASVVAASCASSQQTGPRTPAAATRSHGKRPTFSYIMRDDGAPPAMATIHVKFVEMCVERLRLRPETSGLEEFGADC